MKELWLGFEYQFYTNLLCFVTAVLSSTVTFLRRPSSNNLFVFRYYFLAYSFLTLISYISFFKFSDDWDYIIDRIHLNGDILFTVFEFYVFSNYIRTYIPSSIHNLNSAFFYISAASLYLFPILSGSYMTGPNLIILFCIQAVSLLIICAYYFINTFKKVQIVNLLTEPSFWIVTGLTFFMLSTLPFSLISASLIKKDWNLFVYLFSIFYIFYTILFIMILKGYLCKPVIAK
jgi:hypothetical protein